MKIDRLHRLIFVLVVVIAALLAPTAFAGVPTGSGPNDPLMVTGAWQTLAPNASLWFYFDHTGDKSKIDIALDDNGVSNVQLAIFTPAQAKEWMDDPAIAPIGRGSKPGEDTSAAIHDLTWQGAFNAPGRYLAVVTNSNSTSLAFRLTIRGENVALGPTPTPTPRMELANPFATPVPVGTIQGRLVFQEASGGNIYTVNGDGSNLKRITYGLDPSWSPDGKRIAFVRWDPPAGLFVANVGDPKAGKDGQNELQLLNVEKALSPQWSPDGTRVALTRQKGGTLDDKRLCFYSTCFNMVADPHWKIVVVDENSGALTEPICSKHCFSPTWSSDNQTLAYADATFGILKADTAPDGGPPSNLFIQNPAVQSTRYSPDGRRIAFQVRQHDHWEINVVNADGSDVSAVTHADPLSSRVVNSVAPTWSPDGKQILFLSDRNGKWEFFITDLDGSKLQVLKNVSDSIPIRYDFSSERVVDWVR